MTKLLREIQATGVLPGSYFPSRYYPKTLATEAPGEVVASFRAMVEQWPTWYPQDIGTPFHTELERVYQLTD